VTKGVIRLSHFSGGLLARVERRDDIGRLEQIPVDFTRSLRA